MKRYYCAILCVLLLLVAPLALAQSVRSLGMGSVTAPGDAAGTNPAFLAIPGEASSIALPLGALNALRSDRLDYESETFDLLTVLNQATQLNSFLFNPASSPDEVTLAVRELDGLPSLQLNVAGGSDLLITRGRPIAFQQTLDLPLRFKAGVVGLGVRPYLTASSRFTPGSDLIQVLKGAGSSSASAALSTDVEVGVSVEVSYAAPVTLPEGHDFPGEVYLGLRAAPFVGLARADANGEASLRVFRDADSELAVEADYRGHAFLSTPEFGGLGFGLRSDFGAAAVIPGESGTITAGFSLTDLGFSTWQGEEIEIGSSSDQVDGDPASDRQLVRRNYIADGLGVAVTAAYDFDMAGLSLEGVDSLLIAVDGALQRRLLSAHVGAEAGFALDSGTFYGRAGLGYDSGLILGVGAGYRHEQAVGIDAALHSRQAPLTAHHAFGVSLGVSFGF